MAAMKVKTFTGPDTKKVDKEVNDWLAKTGITVVKTDTAIKELRIPMQRQEMGSTKTKTVYRVVPAIAISVWYKEPAKQK